MIANLIDFFKSEQEIFLNTVSYTRIENTKTPVPGEIILLCQDNVKASLEDEGVKLIVTRSLVFDPKMFFELTVSFGAVLRFNEKRNEINWNEVNLAEEFRENGGFITDHLMSRISLLIAQITYSFGQQPLVLPSILAKKNSEDAVLGSVPR